MPQPTVPVLADVMYWATLPYPQFEAALAKAGIVDGLPMAPVQKASIEAALRAAGLGREDVVASLSPLAVPGKAQSLAICSLLAGCEPEDFPVVVAAVKAFSESAFNGFGVFTTTGGTAVATVVNGPAGQRFNQKGNLLGPGHRANATVGRAVSLISQVIGGAVPGVTDMATMGSPGKYTLCFAENEGESPWEPLHVSRGFAAEQSTATVFAVSGTIEVANFNVATADDVLDTLVASLLQPGSFDFVTGRVSGGRCLLLVSPEWATMLSREGLSRPDVCDELVARAVWSVDVFRPGFRSAAVESTGLTNATDKGHVYAFGTADDVSIVVGGGVGMKQVVMPGWGGGSVPVTVAIE